MIVSESKAGSRLLLAKVEDKNCAYVAALFPCRFKLRGPLLRLQIMVGCEADSIQQELRFSDA